MCKMIDTENGRMENKENFAWQFFSIQSGKILTIKHASKVNIGLNFDLPSTMTGHC